MPQSSRDFSDGPEGRAARGPSCVLRVVRQTDAVEVVGEAHLSEDLPSMVWVVASFPFRAQPGRAVREANALALRHAHALDRIRVAEVITLDDEA